MARGMRVTTAPEAGIGYQESRALNAPTIQVRANPVAFGAATGSALQDIGQAGLQASDNAARLMARIQEAQQRQQELDGGILATRRGMQAQLSWLERIQDMQKAAAPGAAGFSAQVQKDYDKWKEGELAAMPDEFSKRKLEEKLTGLEVNLVGEAATYERQAGDAHRKVQKEGLIEDAQTLALLKPERAGAITAELAGQIDQMGGSPDERAEAVMHVTHAITEASWRGRIDDDPAGVYEALKTTGAPGLNMESRQQLIGAARAELNRREADAREAVNLKLRLEERAERQAEKALRERERSMQRAGDDLVRSGGMSMDWLIGHRQNLDPGDYRYFSEVLAGGHVITSPDRYAELRDAASAATTPDAIDRVRQEAREGLNGKWLSISDYDRLDGLMQPSAEQKLPGWYKAGESYIRTTIAVSDINPDPAIAQKRALVMDDWLEWANAHPKATEREARDAYRSMAGDATLIDMAQFTVANPRPHYLVGSLEAPDIEATESATVQAYLEKHGGDMEAVKADPEFLRQAALVQKWRVATDYQRRSSELNAGQGGATRIR